MNHQRVIKCIGLTAIMLIAGCSVSDKSLQEAQKKIDDLKAKGVPDSMLSPAKVFIFQAKDANTRGENSTARHAYDSLKYFLARAEGVYHDQILNLQPSIDSIKSIMSTAKTQLTGMQAKKVDSVAAKMDSLVNVKQYLKSFEAGKELTILLPTLKVDEERAVELKGRIPGVWVCVNVTKGQEIKEINATERKTFEFAKDGNVSLIEQKKGQSGAFLKEDWEFRSWGTWDVGGDTVFLKINRFKAVKQNMMRLYIDGKKRTWKPENGATYDSTITDGSQDRYVVFSDLKEDFKQEKKY